MVWLAAEDVLLKHSEILGKRQVLRSNLNKERRELWCVAKYCILLDKKSVKIRNSIDQFDSADVEIQDNDQNLYKFQVVEATNREYQDYLYKDNDCSGDGFPESPSFFIDSLRNVIKRKEEKLYSDVGSLNLLIYFNMSIIPLSERERDISLHTLSGDFKLSPFLSICVLWATDEFGAKIDIIKGKCIA